MKQLHSEPLVIELGSRSYPIHLGSGLDDALSSQLAAWRSDHRGIALITDETVLNCQQDFIQRHFPETPRFVLPAGEPHKNLHHFIEAQEHFAQLGLDRSSVFVAFGGGVVGDFSGFVAATYLRGVEFVQIPTTLLSMVDSSVGGKTGVNLKAGKNLVGAFHQPHSVWIDLDRLQTLDSRQFSAGMAEIIKAGLLADRDFFDELESLPRLHPADPALAGVIRKSCSIKAEVVAADEKEQAASGGRALLNLGHTFGHAIEQNTQYEHYLHGEAIAVGLVMAAELSRLLGYIDTDGVKRIENVIAQYDLPTRLDPALSLTSQSLLEVMSRDKKKKQGSMKYVLLETVGKAITQRDLNPTLILDALNYGGAE